MRSKNLYRSVRVLGAVCLSPVLTRTIYRGTTAKSPMEPWLRTSFKGSVPGVAYHVCVSDHGALANADFGNKIGEVTFIRTTECAFSSAEGHTPCTKAPQPTGLACI